MEIHTDLEKNILLSLNSIGNFLNKKYNNLQIENQITQMFQTILQNCVIKFENQNSEDSEALNIVLSFQHLKTDIEKENAFKKLITFCYK